MIVDDDEEELAEVSSIFPFNVEFKFGHVNFRNAKDLKNIFAGGRGGGGGRRRGRRLGRGCQQ